MSLILNYVQYCSQYCSQSFTINSHECHLCNQLCVKLINANIYSFGLYRLLIPSVAILTWRSRLIYCDLNVIPSRKWRSPHQRREEVHEGGGQLFATTRRKVTSYEPGRPARIPTLSSTSITQQKANLDRVRCGCPQDGHLRSDYRHQEQSILPGQARKF